MSDVAEPPSASARRIEMWFHIYGRFGAAMCVPGNAAFATQAAFFGYFAQRLAANPRVPMVVVEGAHQVHDLTLALADASAALLELALAPCGAGLRRAEAARVP